MFLCVPHTGYCLGNLGTTALGVKHISLGPHPCSLLGPCDHKLRYVASDELARDVASVRDVCGRSSTAAVGRGIDASVVPVSCNVPH